MTPTCTVTITIHVISWSLRPDGCNGVINCDRVSEHVSKRMNNYQQKCLMIEQVRSPFNGDQDHHVNSDHLLILYCVAPT